MLRGSLCKILQISFETVFFVTFFYHFEPSDGMFIRMTNDFFVEKVFIMRKMIFIRMKKNV